MLKDVAFPACDRTKPNAKLTKSASKVLFVGLETTQKRSALLANVVL
jgi:hypothetical protein